MRVLAINGSTRKERANTTKILSPFLDGLEESGAITETIFINALDIKPCKGCLSCWRTSPGECIIEDDMQTIYPKLAESDILVIASPVYSPLPGVMQDFCNRIVSLLDPTLEFQDGRTRAKFRDHVKISKFVLVSAGGWWEIENFDRLILIVKDLAHVASVEFSGALLRPHFALMNERPDKSKEILDAATEAGRQLVKNGTISPDLLRIVCQPLISQEDMWKRYKI